MYLDVADREALAEYVRALQVVKRMGIIATLRGLEGAKDFGVDCVVQRIAHSWWGPMSGGTHKRTHAYHNGLLRVSVNEENMTLKLTLIRSFSLMFISTECSR